MAGALEIDNVVHKKSIVSCGPLDYQPAAHGSGMCYPLAQLARLVLYIDIACPYPISRLSGLLLEIPRGLLQAKVALLVRAAGAESDTNKRGPSSALEQKNGEDDTETETEGRLDEEVGKAAVPLFVQKRLAHRSGNGARGRGDGGLSHGDGTGLN